MIDNEKILRDGEIDVDSALNLLGDIETYKSIMSDFVNSYSTRITRIRSYKEREDLTNLVIEVHSLKSDSSYLGYTSLAKLSEEMEHYASKSDIENIEKNYKVFTDEFERVVKLSREYLKRSGENGITISVESVVENKIDEIKSDKKIVLIADDSRIIRDFIKETFDNEYEVIGLKDGSEVESIISMYSDKIAVLLLDLNMPEVDGFKVLEYFKRNDLYKKIPVSIITGNDDKNIINKAFNYPIVSMLNKPFNKKDVEWIVKKTIDAKDEVKV